MAVDVGLMGLTSQLTQTPPNDLLAGTTPIQKLMAANLPPGGRFVNYDPQTYSSYPGSLQGVPDLNIIPGLPSVSGYASIVNGNYESVTNTHEQDDLDIGQLSSGTLGRLDLREVVTVPEYFLVPLQAMPSSFDDFTQTSENIGSDPVLPGVTAATTTTPPTPSIRARGPPSTTGRRPPGSTGSPSSRRPSPWSSTTRPARERASASGRCSRAARHVGARRSPFPRAPAR